MVVVVGSGVRGGQVLCTFKPWEWSGMETRDWKLNVGRRASGYQNIDERIKKKKVVYCAPSSSSQAVRVTFQKELLLEAFAELL